ncbi:MAG: hypothetical protein NHB32_28785 [Fischerella sp. CENA71]|nr:hypothetical protein [Fischerella sp. CENA71]
MKSSYLISPIQRMSRFGLITIIASSSVILAMGTIVAQAKLTNQSKVVINGIGDVRVGMTVKQASQAANTRITSLNGSTINNKGCFYVKPEGEPKGVTFMLTDGRIARVDVSKNSNITTNTGAKIGDSESRIKSLYPGQIKVEAHKYISGGHYLIFVPKNKADSNYRLIFETDGKKVTEIRSGKLPEVEYVERCG